MHVYYKYNHELIEVLSVRQLRCHFEGLDLAFDGSQCLLANSGRLPHSAFVQRPHAVDAYRAV